MVKQGVFFLSEGKKCHKTFDSRDIKVTITLTEGS